MSSMESVRPPALTPHDKDSPRIWIAVVILSACYVFSLIDRLIINLLVDPIKADLGLSDLQIALVQGPAFAVLYATAGAPLGRLADIVSRRGLAAAAIAFWSACTAVTGAAANFLTLAAARVGVGVGEAALTPAAYSLFADGVRRDRLGRAIAIYTAGGALGSGLALLGGGWLYGAFEAAGTTTAPWRLTLLAVGLPGLLLAAAVLLLVKEPPRRDAEARPAVRSVLAWLALHRRFYGWTFAAYAALSTLIYGFMAWTPSYLIRTFEIAPGEAGMRFGTAMLIGGVAGPLFAGWAVDRAASRLGLMAPLRVMAAAFVCAIAAILALPWITGPGSAVILLGIVGFFATGMLGLPPIALQLATPGLMRGLVSGINLMIGNLIGLSLGPVAVALLSSRLAGGLAPALVSVVVASALAGILALLCARVPRPSTETPRPTSVAPVTHEPTQA